ncbi:helix-turn-helix domain-containing protein [Staphylococcus saprophyticus]|uniref:helix-turn-helix domain-containing protein n=1 Tax=Staphylococcus saprophyticus TaxID=29385 RepID=UPI0030BA5C9E
MFKSKVDEWKTSENLLLIEGWARDGLTNDQIAQNIGVTPRTLYNWAKKHVLIFQSLKRGKEVVDRQVENALFNKAIGYEYTEEQVTPDGQIVTVTKYMKPDTTAQIFWLKNRKPNQWRDKQNIEHDAHIHQNIDLTNISEKELRKLAKINE